MELTAVATLASLLTAITTLVIAHWVRQEDSLREVLDMLTDSDRAHARNIVGSAARSKKLGRRAKEEFISAAFTVLWAIDRTDVLTGQFKKERQGTTERKQIYNHLEVITRDLDTAIHRHGSGGDWNPTVDRVNEVLDSLPSKVKTPVGTFLASKNVTRIRTPCC